jgi:hypothetical protein
MVSFPCGTGVDALVRQAGSTEIGVLVTSTEIGGARHIGGRPSVIDMTGPDTGM